MFVVVIRNGTWYRCLQSAVKPTDKIITGTPTGKYILNYYLTSPQSFTQPIQWLNNDKDICDKKQDDRQSIHRKH